MASVLAGASGSRTSLRCPLWLWTSGRPPASPLPSLLLAPCGLGKDGTGALASGSAQPAPLQTLEAGHLWPSGFVISCPELGSGHPYRFVYMQVAVSCHGGHHSSTWPPASLGLQALCCLLIGVSPGLGTVTFISEALRSPPQLLPCVPAFPLFARPGSVSRKDEGRPVPSSPSAQQSRRENQEARSCQGSGAGLGPRRRPLPAPPGRAHL